MKFICEKSLLQYACSIASRAVPSKSPISSLEGLYIESIGNSIRITGYDLKKGIYTEIESEIEEQGTIVVNSRFFGEMIRRMPDGMVTISTEDNNNINAKCGRSEFNFIGLEIKDYPELPKFDGLSSLEIPQSILKSMINETIFAVARDEIRPVYTGSLFEVDDNTLNIVSVDGYRLAKRCEVIENSKLENCSFVVPGFALSDIEKICDDSDEKVVITIGDKHVSFKIGNSVVMTRRLEGEFINHRKSIPENFRYTVKVSRDELQQVIDRVALVLIEKNANPIKMIFEDGTINCSCTTPIGKADDICICEGSGEGLEIGFNDRYVTDSLKAAKNEELLLCLNTSSSPCVIKAADGTDKFTYMILPVRLHTGK